MSTSSAPASTASVVSASFTATDAAAGKAVATAATFTRGAGPAAPPSAATATGTRSLYTQTAATGGHPGSSGSGRSALAHSARTVPGVSAPSSVVRSIIRMARSSAQALAVVLIERVASPATRSLAPTSSTPGRPCRNRRSAPSRMASASSAGRVAVAMAESVTAQGRRPNGSEPSCLLKFLDLAAGHAFHLDPARTPGR